MNYSKIYNDLVAKALPRGTDKSLMEGYFELHHIIPRCMGGSDDKSNLVMFTGREHFIAHKLLWRAYPEEVSLMRAAHMMASRWQAEFGYKSNSKIYEKLRTEYAEAVRVQCTGEGNPFFGKKHSQETLNKIAISRAKTEAAKRLSRGLDPKKPMSKNPYIKRITTQKKPFQMYPDPIKNQRGGTPMLKEEYLEPFRHKGALVDWLTFNVYKDYWERSNRPGKKLFCSCVNDVSETTHNGSYFNTMVQRFEDGWVPEDNPSFIVKALNNNSDEYISKVERQLVKTIFEIRQEYKLSWLENREDLRKSLELIIAQLEIQAHQNNGNSKLSIVDVAEAILVWESGLVEQKDIASVLGIAKNSLSTTLSNEKAWVCVKENMTEIYTRLNNKELVEDYGKAA